MDEFYLFINSYDSLDLYPHMRGGNFKVQLPKTYHMEGEWECALLEINFVPAFKYPTQRVYVTSSIVGNESYANNALFKILQSVSVRSEEITEIIFERPMYHRVTQKHVSFIDITLRDDHLRVCDTKDDHVFCLLHFHKKEESVKHL